MLISRATTSVTSVEAEKGTLANGAKIVSDTSASGGSAVEFKSPLVGTTLCQGRTPLAHQYTHIVWIWMENQQYSAVIGNTTAAPYENTLAHECATSNAFYDSSLPDLPSGPNYLAYVSGGNCNSNGLSDVTKTGCITTDLNTTTGTGYNINAQTIFQQVIAAGLTWKSYSEAMTSNCEGANSGNYAVRHNPAPFFNNMTTLCDSNDIGFPAATCNSTTAGKPCTMPTGTNVLLNDINNGTLPNFTTITPEIGNDMHSPGTVQQGDNWLSTYLPLLFKGPNYQSGNTAVFVLWDEGSGGKIMANIEVAPTIVAGSTSSVTTNQIGVLWNTQLLLGLGHTIGCSAGGSSCPAGSTNDFTTSFKLR